MNPPSQSILFVTRDKQGSAYLIDALEQEHFPVVLEKKQGNGPDDRMFTGIDMCIIESEEFSLAEISTYSGIRGKFSGPILALSSEIDVLLQVLLFEHGVDDLLFMPVNPLLFLARIRALFRRSRTGIKPRSLVFNQLEINGGARTVSYKGHTLTLSTKEFDLLWFLARNAYSTMDRDSLYENVLGIEYNGYDRSVDMYVSRIRTKFSECTDLPEIIKTVRGKGYLFAADHL